MAILFEQEVDGTILVVYQIENSREYYMQGIDFTDFDSEEFEKIKNEEKQLQWLASRYWLKKISKQQYTLHLQKSELGKPHISNFSSFFSISHSRDKIAVIYSKDRNVAIDIEHIQSKIAIVKHKFLNNSDYLIQDDLVDLALIWSAKETIYKYFHDKSLYSFKETIAIVKRNEDILDYKLFSTISSHLNLNYLVLDSLVLTWM